MCPIHPFYLMWYWISIFFKVHFSIVKTPLRIGSLQLMCDSILRRKFDSPSLGMAEHSQPRHPVEVPRSLQSESQTTVPAMTFYTCKLGAWNSRNTEHLCQVTGGHNKLPNVNSKIVNQYKLIHDVFVPYNVYISGVMNNSFLFAIRCSLTPWLVPVSQNLPSNSQQAVPPRLSLGPPGEDLVCCT